jgi:uroporphyrinogen decarboxylase
MDHFERIQAALHGQTPDRVPISFWRHFPLDDRSAESLAKRMVDWQTAYDLDFVKVMLERYGPLPDWGANIQYYDPDPFRLGEIQEPLVKTLDDWEHLTLLDVRRGSLARDVEVVRLIAAQSPPDVPIIQTVFTPFTLALKAAGPTLYAHLRTDPTPVLRALERTTETLSDFVAASFEAGAWGVFYAIQGTERDRLTLGEHRRWAEPFDMRVLEAAKGRRGFNVLHIHGANTLFQELDAYPADVVNWEPGNGNPAISEALKMTGKTLMAGIHHERVADQTLAEAAGSVHAALDEADGGRRLIIGPTCTILPHISPAILRTIERTARGHVPGRA